MSWGRVKTAVLVIVVALSVGVIAHNLYTIASGSAPKAPTGLHLKRVG